MLWLTITIFAYFLFALVALIDKYILTGPIPNAKVYAFYVGIFSIFVLVFLPLGFLIPGPLEIIIGLLAGVVFIFAIFVFYTALIKFEVSRVVPAIGGILPLFTFGLVYLFLGGSGNLGFYQILAFILLIFGSVLISFEKKKLITLRCLQITALAAFLFSLSFIFSKIIYLSQPFWSGFIWRGIGCFLAAIFLLFFQEVRKEVLTKRIIFKPKIAKVFFLNQGLAGTAFIFQHWAIALVPLGSLAFINALEGVKYVFLLIFAVLLSLKFPKFLKEEISSKALLQKIIAILLIGTGILFLSIC